MKLVRLVTIAALLTVALGAHQAMAGEPAQTQATQAVWDNHIQAFMDRDMARILSDYDEESVVIINAKVFKGIRQIRHVFEELFEIFDKGPTRMEPIYLEGRIIYLAWYFTPEGDTERFGTDTFLVEDDKIRIQTIGSDVYDKFKVLPLE